MGNLRFPLTVTYHGCPASSTATNDYVLGVGGEQVTEMAMAANKTMAWQHTNVYAAGTLLATYDTEGLHFYFNDVVGTRRVQTDYAGVMEQTCSGLPFGDDLACSGSTESPTEHHFTGKERDVESGLDYFGARYYASSVGRFNSPDWSAKTEPVPYANLGDPQSLNLYSYVDNNPLSRIDVDGHCWQGFQWVCNVGQSLDNAVHGLGLHTDAGVENNLHNANQYLRQHGISTEGMRDAAILKTFQTYTKKSLTGGNPYSGRTSGTGTPLENLAARDRRSHLNPEEYGPAQLDQSSTNPDAIRGREQQLIDANGGARSQGGTSGNAINGISDTNPNRDMYMNSADGEFGPYMSGDHSFEPGMNGVGGTGCGLSGQESCE